MVFIIPIKRTSLSKSTRFSKFRDLIESELFILQERKKHVDTSNTNDNKHKYKQPTSIINTPRNTSTATTTNEHDNTVNNHPDEHSATQTIDSKTVYNAGASLVHSTPNINYHRSDTSTQQRDNHSNNTNNTQQSQPPPPPVQHKHTHHNIFSHRPNYRIITKGYNNNSYYELAYGSDLLQLKSNEWLYMTNELPQLMPPNLANKQKLKWLLSHLTQKAIELDDTGILIDSAIENKDVDYSDIDDIDEVNNTVQQPASPTPHKSMKSPKLQPVESNTHKSPRDNKPSHTLNTSTVRSYIPMSPHNEHERSSSIQPHSPLSPVPIKYSQRQHSAVSNDDEHDYINPLRQSTPNKYDLLPLRSQPNHPSITNHSCSEMSITSRDRTDSIDSDIHTNEQYYNHDNDNHINDNESTNTKLSNPLSTRHNRAVTQASFANRSISHNTIRRPPGIHRPRSFSQSSEQLSTVPRNKTSDDERYVQDDSSINESDDDDHKFYKSNKSTSTNNKSINSNNNKLQRSTNGTFYRNTITDSNLIRRGDLYSISGYSTWFMVASVLCMLSILVRDASINTFIIYMMMLYLCTYILIQRSTPFRLSILLENMTNKQSVNTLPLSSLPHYNGPAGTTLTSKHGMKQRKPSGLSINLSNTNHTVLQSSSSRVQSPLSAPTTADDTVDSIISDVDDTVQHNKQPHSGGIQQDDMKLQLPSTDDEPLSAPPVHDGTTLLQRQLSRNTHQTNNKPSGIQTQRMPLFAITSYDKHIPFSPGKRDPQRIPYGSTLSHGIEPGQHNSWYNADATTFSVRSASYKHNKIKVPSAPALYDTIGMDIFYSEHKLMNISDVVQLPLKLKRKNIDTLQYEYKYDDEEVDGWEVDYDLDVGVPELLVIQFQLPAYDPGYMSKKDDGIGYSTVFYYQLTDKGRNEFRNNATPAVRAFKEFILNCSNESYHNRFKAIPRVNNPDQCHLNMALKRLLKTYSMKPFLTGPHCHGFTVRKGYMQVDIDVHQFWYVVMMRFYTNIYLYNDKHI